MFEAARRARLLRVIGAALFLAALMLYESAENRPVAGRWSYPHAALIALATGVALLAARSSWRARRRTSPVPLAALLLDTGICTWGLAYLINALDARDNAGRIADLNVFGSVAPVPAILEWISLVALSLAAGMAVVPRLKPRWQNAALLIAGVWAFVLLGECVFRARAVIAPATAGFPTYTGASWMRRYVRVNAAGFRDAEHRPERTAGVPRLCVIGDSFAFGIGVDRTADRFGEHLRDSLERATGQSWEVVNVSRPDSHTLQEMQLLDAGLSLKPDVVVLVYVFNDIDYLRPATARSTLTEAPQSALGRVHPLRLLYKNSYLFQESYVRVRLLTSRGRIADDPYADSAIVRRHLADLAEFVRTAERSGATVGIVPFDQTVATQPASRRRYAQFVRWGRAAGLPIWAVDHAFDGRSLAELSVNSLDHHPNALANRLAANAVVPRLVEVLSSRTEAASGHLAERSSTGTSAPAESASQRHAR